ncbi:MAG TPA: ethanolamine ammonia-lyase subunit EutC [Hyphomonas sp.]|nr:ethanolamine ammonia-lyase subunit EutC [Hyphomonas sp.]
MSNNNRREAELLHGWRQATPARIALGRYGSGMPTRAHLDFQLAHAQARDAVHSELDLSQLTELLSEPALTVRSAAADRSVYLKRPDLGRILADNQDLQYGPYDAAIILADGLSASAILAHGATIAKEVRRLLEGWNVAPFVIAEQARVALGDDIAVRLGAKLAIVLIGERPGLSAADSVGAYLTWSPRRGRVDSQRNCVSNIRSPNGLPPQIGAANIAWLARNAKERQMTGVGLKDDFSDQYRIKSEGARIKHSEPDA